jgi:hypothetical protein
MEKQSTKARQIYLVIAALIVWSSVIAQFYLAMINRQTSVSEALIRFFTYFTIQTNLLVAVLFTTLLLKPHSGWGRFFTRPGVATAICTYIVFVGLTYNILLRQLWQPTGLQQTVDELLHSVVPIVFILYWLIYVLKNDLKWKNIFIWLIYPVIYIIIVLIRGAVSGYYPYPFIDVNTLGYPRVFLNGLGLIIAFLLLSGIFVGIGKFMNRIPHHNPIN